MLVVVHVYGPVGCGLIVLSLFLNKRVTQELRFRMSAACLAHIEAVIVASDL